MCRNNILLLYVMKSKTENDTCKFYIVNVRILKIREVPKHTENTRNTEMTTIL